MLARVNTYALRQTSLESARLGTLATVAHPMTKPGRFAATVYSSETVVARFGLLVADDQTAAQADVDLASLVSGAARGRTSIAPGEERTLRTGGYLVLYVSEGAGGFWMVLDHLPEREGKPMRVFDTRMLGPGDMFVATLLRPGIYAMAEAAGAQGTIEVSYPTPGPKPFQPDAPHLVKVTKEGFHPDKLVTAPTQGVIFTIEMVGGAIRIELREPNDSGATQGVAGRSVRWTKPGASLSRDAAKPPVSTGRKRR